MIAVAVTDYDDQNIVEECETGWRRFCIEVLVRTHYFICELCRKHQRHGFALTNPKNRKAAEVLRRQVSAYRWVFGSTGGEFSFDQTCADLGLDSAIVRRRLLSQAKPRPDINLLVDWVVRQQEMGHGCDRRRQDQAVSGVGTGVVARVRNLRRKNSKREGRRGAQSHAVCRGKDGHKDRRRPAGAI